MLQYLLFFLFWGCAKKSITPAKVMIPSDTGETLSANLNLHTSKSSLDKIKKLQQEVESFSAITYTDDDEVNARLVLIKKHDKMREIVDKALELIDKQETYGEVTAGVYLGSTAELRYAQMILSYPIPSGLPEMGDMVFQERLISYVQEIKEKSKKRLEILINNELRSELRGDFALLALQELHQYFPLDYRPIPHSKGTEIDALSSYILLIDRSQYWPQLLWPDDKQKSQKLIANLSKAEANVKMFQQRCSQLQGQVKNLHLYGELYCLGRNAAIYDLLIAQKNGEVPKRLQEAQKIYQRVLAKNILQLKNTNEKEAFFWYRQLEQERRQASRQKKIIKRSRKGEVELDIRDVDLVWEYKEQVGPIDKVKALHLRVHAHRIHFYVERFLRLSRRLPTNHDGKIRKLKDDFPKKLRLLTKESKEVLAYYPEIPAHRDRILMALGLAYVQYAAKVLDNLRHFNNYEFDTMMELAANYQLAGLRLLKLCSERKGDRSRWATRAEAELRRFSP